MPECQNINYRQAEQAELSGYQREGQCQKMMCLEKTQMKKNDINDPTKELLSNLTQAQNMMENVQLENFYVGNDSRACSCCEKIYKVEKNLQFFKKVVWRT